MCERRITITALAVGALLTGVAAAGDTKRLVDRPADRTDTRTLELKPADRDADTELTRWGRGGWGGGWGGYGWGRGWGWGGGHHGHWGFGIGLGYYGGYRPWGGYWGGYRPWGLGYYGWPSYSAGSWGWPYSSYSLYSTAYYAPVYSYYPVPAVSYDAAPVYYSSPLFIDECCPPVSVIREGVEVRPPASGGTFRYDGGPVRQIPPARQADPPPTPKESGEPTDPKLGPTPTDRPVSLPAARKKYEYPAYGEGPDARPARRPAKELLVSK